MTAYHFLPFFWTVPRISVPFGSNRLGTSSRRQVRRSCDVRRSTGATKTTVRPTNPKIHPRPSGPDVAPLHRGSSGRARGGAEIPSRTALWQARVACHAPHSRNLVVGARKRPSSMSRKGPLTRYFRWWRGQDLNLRPSGYERSGASPNNVCRRWIDRSSCSLTPSSPFLVLPPIRDTVAGFDRQTRTGVLNVGGDPTLEPTEPAALVVVAHHDDVDVTLDQPQRRCGPDHPRRM